MDKLEQVSENPELKEEMEREVTSTNSQVLTQAASWANWAVGAIGAKFYKSANKPPQPSSNQNEPSEAAKKSNNSTTSEEASKKSSIIDINDAPAQAASSSGDGWDVDNDDDDWGSLEEPKAADNSKSNEITREDLDTWLNDFGSNKGPDKTAVVKQGIQTLQLVRI